MSDGGGTSKAKLLLCLIVFFWSFNSYAHRSGCHRWHSCPSDSGSYVCGDLGCCSGCPDNQYCQNGQKRKFERKTASQKVAVTKLQVKVVKVADGDTITVLTEDKRQIRVRLYGIDTPERRQPFGKRAKQFTSALVFGQEVSIEVIGRDRYRRSVALVRLSDGRFLNEELLKSGLAWVYTRYCKKAFCDRWKAIETQAKTEKRGLFRNENALEPWKARRRRPSSH